MNKKIIQTILDDGFKTYRTSKDGTATFKKQVDNTIQFLILNKTGEITIK